MEKEQGRIVNPKGKWKLLPGIFSIILMAVLVLAAAPSTPTTMSPANNSLFFNNISLSCSGSTDADGDDINYLFWYYRYMVNTSAGDDGTWTYTGDCGANCYFNIGDSYANSSALAVDDTASSDVYKNVKFLTDEFRIQIEVGESQEISASFRINGTLMQFWNSNSGPTNITYDVSQYNDGNDYSIQFIVVQYSDGPADIFKFWWDANQTELLQNSSSTSYVWDVNQGVKSWLCNACDNNSDCSSFTDLRQVNRMNFTSCTSGNVALNLTFEGENNNGTKINGFIPDLSFTFDSDDSGDYLFTFQNNTDTGSYSFCLNPDTLSIDTIGTIKYASSGFPQRTVGIDMALNGSDTYDKTLYLLGVAEGIYVTFQVVDVGNNVIEDVYISASKVLDGTLTEVSSGYTDASGSVTFWLDPDTQHTFSASKTGVGSTSFSLSPTQSSYTITMGSSTLTNQTSTFIGISYLTNPTEMILNTNQTYNFTLDVNSSYWNLSSFGFNLYNETDLLISQSNNSITGGFLLYEYNTTLNDTKIVMDYWWLIDGNYTNITKTWNVRDTYVGEHSLQQFFVDFKNYASVGFNAGYDTFGGIIISLVLLVLIVGALSYSFGVYSPLGIMSLIFVTVAILEYTEILPPLIRKGLLSAILIIILVGYFAMEQSR